MNLRTWQGQPPQGNRHKQNKTKQTKLKDQRGNLWGKSKKSNDMYVSGILQRKAVEGIKTWRNNADSFPSFDELNSPHSQESEWSSSKIHTETEGTSFSNYQVTITVHTAWEGECVVYRCPWTQGTEDLHLETTQEKTVAWGCKSHKRERAFQFRISNSGMS